MRERSKKVLPTHCLMSPGSTGFQLGRVTPITPQQPLQAPFTGSHNHGSVKTFSPSFPDRLAPNRETSFSPPCGESFYEDHVTPPLKETVKPLQSTSVKKPVFCFKPLVKQCHQIDDTNSVDSYMTEETTDICHNVDSYDREMSCDSLSDMLADDDDLPSISGPTPKKSPTMLNTGMS